VTSLIFKGAGKKINIPWFFFFFVLAMIVNTYLLLTGEAGLAAGRFIHGLVRKSLMLPLFFIGASLSMAVLRDLSV